MLKQTTMRVEEEALETFKRTAQALGTSPAEAMRMFIYAFNRKGGFPFDVSLDLSQIPPSFRKIYTEEELANIVDQAISDMEAGNVLTHEEVFAEAYRIIEDAEARRVSR